MAGNNEQVAPSLDPRYPRVEDIGSFALTSDQIMDIEGMYKRIVSARTSLQQCEETLLRRGSEFYQKGEQ